MKKGWVVTVVGSGILLILITIFAATTARQVTRVYSELSTNDQLIQDLETQLSGLRSDIYRSGIYVRDQFLDAKSPLVEGQRDLLHDLHDSMEERLDKIAELVPADQADKIQGLRREIAGYWRFVAPVAGEDDGRIGTDWMALREQLATRRDSSLAIAREIGLVNRLSYQERHDHNEAAEQALLNYIWTMMGFTLFLGAIVFASSTYIVSVLNRRAERQREAVERAEAELRHLSSDLFESQEKERKVLSRELHDEVGQILTALVIELGAVDRLKDGSVIEFKEHLDEAKRLAHQTLKTVRNVASGLRPVVSVDMSLVPAVRYLGREFSRRFGIPVSVDIQGNFDRLPEAHRTCVYRAIQEALTNCAKHAYAKSIRISLRGEAQFIALEVEDDGVGLGRSTETGLGLAGIRERAKELKGEVDVRSALNEGTVLQVVLPLLGSAAS